MANYKSVLTSMIVFIAFFFPAIMNFSIGALHYTAFFKTTLDLVDYVRVEGGVSDNIKNHVSYLENRYNFDITFRDAATGQVIDSVVPVTTNVEINYKYEYTDVSKANVLETSNSVLILRR